MKCQLSLFIYTWLNCFFIGKRNKKQNKKAVKGGKGEKQWAMYFYAPRELADSLQDECLGNTLLPEECARDCRPVRLVKVQPTQLDNHNKTSLMEISTGNLANHPDYAKGNLEHASPHRSQIVNNNVQSTI